MLNLVEVFLKPTIFLFKCAGHLKGMRQLVTQIIHPPLQIFVLPNQLLKLSLSVLKSFL
jgi:hypothetical protein